MSSRNLHLSLSNKNSTGIASPKPESRASTKRSSIPTKIGSVQRASVGLETQGKTSSNSKPLASESRVEVTTSVNTAAPNSSINDNDLSSSAVFPHLNNLAEKEATHQIPRWGLGNAVHGAMNAMEVKEEHESQSKSSLGEAHTAEAFQKQHSTMCTLLPPSLNIPGTPKTSRLVSLSGSPFGAPKRKDMTSPSEAPYRKAQKAPSEENIEGKSPSSEAISPFSELYVGVRVRPAANSVASHPSPCTYSSRAPSRAKYRSDFPIKGSISSSDLGFLGLETQSLNINPRRKTLKTFVKDKAIECLRFTGSDTSRHFSEKEEGLSPASSANALRFTYNAVFDENSTQDDVMRAIGEKAVDRVIAGYHGTVLCYGQSGCGKTYSLVGPQGGKIRSRDICRTSKKNPTSSEHPLSPDSSFVASRDRVNTQDKLEYEFAESVGMLPRMLLRLFQRLEATTTDNDNDMDANSDHSKRASWSVSLSAVELYNEELHDLVPHPISGIRTRHSKSEKTKKPIPEGGEESANTVLTSAQANDHEGISEKGKNTLHSSSLEALTEELESTFAEERSKRQSPKPVRADRYGSPSLASVTGNEKELRRISSLVEKGRKKENTRRKTFPSGLEATSTQREITSQRGSPPEIYSNSLNLISFSRGPITSLSPLPSGRLSLGSMQGRGQISASNTISFERKPPSLLRIRNTVEKGNISTGEEKQANPPSLSITIDGLRTHPVRSFDEVMQVIFHALLERKMAYTRLNINSNRAHTLFFVHVVQKNPLDLSVKHSILTLVDLAGSERVSQTGAEGVRLLEARKINLSLLLLGNVFRQLGQKQHRQHLASTFPSTSSSAQAPQYEYIPYRSSNLTRLLKDSFGGNTFTFLLCNVSPDPQDLQETLSTLRFASLARHIRNKPVPNTSQSSSEEVANENERLRAQLKEAREYIAWLKEQANPTLNLHTVGSTRIKPKRKASWAAVNANQSKMEPFNEGNGHPRFRNASNNRVNAYCTVDLVHAQDKESSYYEGENENESEKEEMNMTQKVELAMQTLFLTLRELEADYLADTIDESSCSCSGRGAERSSPFFPLQGVDSANLVTRNSIEEKQGLGKEADGKEDNNAHSVRVRSDYADGFGASNNPIATVSILQNVYGVLRFIRSLYFFTKGVSPITLGSSNGEPREKLGKTDITRTKNTQNLCEQNNKTHSKLSSLTRSISARIQSYRLPYVSRYFKALIYFVSPMDLKSSRGSSITNPSHLKADDVLASALKQCFELNLLGYMDADHQVSKNSYTASVNQIDWEGILLGFERDQRTWIKQLLNGFKFAAVITTSSEEIMPL